MKTESNDTKFIDYSRDIDTSILDLYHKTTRTNHRLNEHLKYIDNVKDKLEPKHLRILMDLGMKNKSTYMQFFKDSGESPITFYLNDKNSIGIPKNIQTIFTNYTLINNMIHKELDYIRHKLNTITRLSHENAELMKLYILGLNNQNMHELYEPENSVSDSEESEEDENVLIKKYIIKEDKDNVDGESMYSRLA